jgi:hypothetical protein
MQLNQDDVAEAGHSPDARPVAAAASAAQPAPFGSRYLPEMKR